MSTELPLTESSFLILATLMEPRHGYAIMKEVENVTDGSVQLGPGTLYGVLKSLVKKSLINEKSSDDPRRRIYLITEMGKDVLGKETNRLKMLVRIGGRALRGEDHE